MFWGIQTNLGKDDSPKLINACKELGLPHVGLMAIPFEAPLPDIPVDTPTIFWGSINWIHQLWESKKWSPGVIFNENFDYRVWNQKWGEHCLNSGAVVTTLKEFSESKHGSEDLFFIRPCADDKSFTGEVIELGLMETWMRNERMIPVRIACEETDIEKIADLTASYYNQIAVMYYKISDYVKIKHYA